MTRLLQIKPLLAIALVFLMAGCQRSSGDDVPADTVSNIPTVVSVTPVDKSTDVGISSLITATFSHHMSTDITSDTTSDTTSDIMSDGYFTVSDTLGTVTYDDKVATFTPASALNHLTTYTATVKAGTKGANGFETTSDYSWSFTTIMAQPEVESVTPEDGSTAVNVSSPVTVTFSIDMSTDIETNDHFTVSDSSGNTPGTVTYNSAEKKATFTPSGSLKYFTIYTAKVLAGTKAANETDTTSDYSWSFTTITAPPEVESVTPKDGTTAVSISSSVTVTFSIDMSTDIVSNDHFTVSDASGNTPGTVTYNSTEKKATFTPSGSLKYFTTYTAKVLAGTKAANKTETTSDYSWSFTTDYPALTVLEIAAGEQHTCARRDDGIVTCWGDNGSGQLGLGNDDSRGDDKGEMGSDRTADLGSNRYALQIVNGSNHTCARLDNGTVKCWGENQSGQLGYGNQDDIGDDGNEMGKFLASVDLGTNTSGTNKRAVEVSAGHSHTCARLDDGTIKCWGNNDSGQLGRGNTVSSSDASGDIATINLGGAKAVEVEAGSYHTCARLNNGFVICWGENEFGQLGIDSTDDIGDDSAVGGDSTADLGTGRKAVELAAGFQHTCARLDNGLIKCWGYNDNGQLGLGHTSSKGDDPNEMGDLLSTVELGTDRTAVQISAGYKHTCVLLDIGTVKCWGLNDYGQLGQKNYDLAIGETSNDMGDYLEAIDLGANRTALSITSGYHHTCARLDTGRIKCWGKNVEGQLGLGDSNPRGNDSSDMGANLATIDLGTGKYSAVGIAVGQRHSCALLGRSEVKCWGDNSNGQLGLGHKKAMGDGVGGNEMGINLPFIDVSADVKVVQIAVGKSHSCVRLDNGSVKCWGNNQYGQLGIDSTSDIGDESAEMGEKLEIVKLGNTRKAVEIEAGGNHTCARLDNSDVICWGYNEYGQLGQNNENNYGDGTSSCSTCSMSDLLVSPIDFGNGIKAVQIAAGENFTCARLDNGTAKCWGSNSNGQLGQGDQLDRGTPSLVQLGSGMSAVQIVAGYTHVCALLDNSLVKCWGHNGPFDGKLGQGSDTENIGDGSTPTVANLDTINLGSYRTVMQIAAGSFHTCGILDNGFVKCWGKNDYGQLGLGDKRARGAGATDMGDFDETADTGLNTVNLGSIGVIEISAGYQHSCARLVNGNVKCWGFNKYGQLGQSHMRALGDESGEMGDDLPIVSLRSQ